MRLHLVIVGFICILSLVAADISYAQRRLAVPKDYPTIQSAINAAKSGDTVLVDEGLYYENLSISKNIILSSRFILDRDTSHINRTIIDGSRARNKLKGSTIFITGPTDTTCLIYGLTICGGTGSYAHMPENRLSEHWIVGGGIFVLNAGARISHNFITKNKLSSVEKFDHISGAGICTADQPDRLAVPATIIIENNIVSENTATGRWIEDCGIGVQQPGIVRHNIITYNRSITKARAPGGGLGLYFRRRYDIIADGNYIRYNSAGFGGGVTVVMIPQLCGRAIVVNNIIADNEAFENGGGLYISRAHAILINNTIAGNKAFSRGSALHAFDGALVILVNNIIWNNNPRPITSPANIQAVNNLIEGGFPGINTIDADPLFGAGDSTFRLSSRSPAIGIGASGVYAGRKFYYSPIIDIWGRQRPSPVQSRYDLGAVESQYDLSDQTSGILDEWEGRSDHQLKLTLSLQQKTPPQYSTDSMQILRAGLLSARIIENDSVEHKLGERSHEPSFTLPPGNNMLRVEFLARGRTESKRLYGILYLEGFESTTRTLPASGDYMYSQYNNLPPGIYTLLFQAGDEVGLIDAVNMKSIKIIVSPYWYQRWWAYGLLVLVAAGLVTTFLSFRIGHLRNERLLQREFAQKQLEYQEAERKRIAAELHDGLGQDLLVVNNELQQFQKEGTFSPGDMSRVTDVLRDTIETVREISTNLHPHHLDRLGFCAAIEAMVERITRASSMTIHARCDQVDALLAKDARIHLYRIIQESLSNVMKHSGATEASLVITRKENRVDITIEDNGKGFDLSRPSFMATDRSRIDIAQGFGIASMKERAAMIGAILAIESEPQNGTRIHLTLPITGA